MIDGLQAGMQRLEDYLAMGGVAMMPLVVVCLLMWTLIADRVLFFRRLQRRDMTPRSAWKQIRRERMPDPRQYGGAVTLITADFLCRRGNDRAMDRHILDETIANLNRRLTGCLPVIGVLAAVAPLLGLLGTVTGMMTAFDVLSIFGTGNARAMANGISEALITTQTGLLIAIPGLYMQGFLHRRAKELQQRITAAGCYLRRQMRRCAATTGERSPKLFIAGASIKAHRGARPSGPQTLRAYSAGRLPPARLAALRSMRPMAMKSPGGPLTDSTRVATAANLEGTNPMDRHDQNTEVRR
jgi:biopolymer transport protein ExbB